MAVSRRLRYEVLRRDNHACRYCGAAAPVARLTVDHVIPIALGGSDEPGNLVTACEDCNGGKAASNPDASTLADVEADALRWSAAIEKAAEIQTNLRDDESKYVDEFVDNWYQWSTDQGDPFVPFLIAWESTIGTLRSAGLSINDLKYATDHAMGNTNIPLDRVWRYFCGICWRMVRERQAIAVALLQTDEAEGPPRGS